jgi:hypothetical protein
VSAADEIELQEAAQELVAEFGRVIQLIPPGSTDVSATEPWKGQTGDGTAVDVPVVFQALNKELVTGTAIQIGDTLGIIASTALSGLQITAAWSIIDGSARWSIVAPVEIRPGRSSFVWFLHLRQAGV